MPKQPDPERSMPEPDKTPEEWADAMPHYSLSPPDVCDATRLQLAKRILAQGKRQERKRILEGLVEAKLLPYAFQVNSRKLLARRKTPLDDGWCHCQKCNHHYDECVCRANRLLRIVNPDAKE